MYEEYYQLSGKPFQLSPDSRFFFNSSGHNRAMAYLRYGLRQGEGFIVITGGIGTGKTMLVAHLFREFANEHLVAAQLVSTQVGDDDMLRMVSASFGLAYENLTKAALLRNLEAFFRARRAEGKRVLLVVDEAQNLPRRSIEELRMLSNYQQDGAALLQSFLIGQAELRATLQSSGMEQVRQRIIAGYHLRPLDRDEMSSYIEHRLKLVAWDENPTFDTAAYDRLFAATAGVPRRVNTLVDRLLLYGAIEELDRIQSTHVETVVAEVAEEIGHSSLPALASEENLPEGQQAGQIRERLEHLEAEVARLKMSAEKEGTILKKMRAILLEMEGVGG